MSDANATLAAPNEAQPQNTDQATLAGGDQPSNAATDDANTGGDDGGAKDGGQADKADKPAGAPEKYEFITPEGQTLDAEVLQEFEGVARELELPQDQAQKLVDKLVPKLQERFAAQQNDVATQARAEWEAQSRADKEFGGAGLEQNMVHAARAMKQLGTPELRTLLNESGLGNHPEVVRMMVRAGKAIGEDTVVTGGDKPAAGDPLTKLYPTHYKTA